jgi:hypothetical protein
VDCVDNGEAVRRQRGHAKRTGGSFARDDLFFCADPNFVEAYFDGLARAGVPA